MIGSILDRWEYTWSDIWEPLVDAPDVSSDLYIDLYRATIGKLKIKISFEQESIISNDPLKALEAFQAIKKRDFKGEPGVVIFFEDVYEALEEYGTEELLNLFFELVESFLDRYNLRYRLERPFHLLVQLPWVYADIYRELCQINQKNSHLKELMNDFEDAFSTFARTRKRRDLRTSIAKASNYAEGVAASRLKAAEGGSLSQMVDRLATERAWPHVNVQNTIKELYSFCNDYPGIRHGSTKNSKKRELEPKDTIIISTLLIAFSGYIQNQVNIKKILD